MRHNAGGKPLHFPPATQPRHRLPVILYALAQHRCTTGRGAYSIGHEHLSAEDSAEMFCAALTALTYEMTSTSYARDTEHHALAAHLRARTRYEPTACELIAAATTVLDMATHPDYALTPHHGLPWDTRLAIARATLASLASLRTTLRPPNAAAYAITAGTLIHALVETTEHGDPLATHHAITDTLDATLSACHSGTELRLVS